MIKKFDLKKYKNPKILFFLLLILFLFFLYYYYNLEAKSPITYIEAKYYLKIDKKIVQCLLCPRKCTISEGGRGFCGVRENKNGKLYSLVYSNPVAVHLDPIEKKPLFHFYPGTSAFSLATVGCNLRCRFCQNWQISQAFPEDYRGYLLPPEKVIEEAKKMKAKTIAYTYTEPVVFFEYMLECAKLAKSCGIKNMFHSAGYINPEPLKEIAKYLDGANIDLKAFNQEFYNKYSFGELKTVLNTLKILKEKGVHLEITNLIIPGVNDNFEEIERMCKWIEKNLGDDVPLHFSRFYPQYKLANLPPTPVETLERAVNIAKKAGLKFVYIGNVPGHKFENTYCPKCQKILIKRRGYEILENHILNGKCKFCGEKIPGKWE
jgi:pyruvate formate lyase activating enzyme